MNQTFKAQIDKNILFDFLENVCEKSDKYYIFNSSSYKRGELNGECHAFRTIKTVLSHGKIILFRKKAYLYWSLYYH